MRIVFRLGSASAIPKVAPVAHPIEPQSIWMCTCTSSGSVIGGTPKLELPLSSTTLSPDRKFEDRKSTRLNSSHQIISYAVFCLNKKNEAGRPERTQSHDG